MGKYILADNQELTRYALEAIIREKDNSSDFYRASDKTGLVEKLKEHENAVVLLDYTLFDFVDKEQLLIVAERFGLSQWILISDDLSPQFLRRIVYSSASHQLSIVYKNETLKDIRDALDAVSRHTHHISQRALETIILQQQQEDELPSVLTTTEMEIVKAIAQGKSTKEMPPSVSPASIPSPPIARIAFANWESTPPMRSSSMPFGRAWSTPRSSISELLA